MAKEEKLRCEVDNNDKWDLTLIYKTDDNWYKDLESLEKYVNNIINYRDTFSISGKNLYEFFKNNERVERKLNKLYYYAHLNYDSDTLNEEYGIMYNKISDLYTLYSENTSFVVPMILKLDEETIEKYYKEEPKLEEYRFSLNDVRRYKDHTLSEDKEKMLSALGKCLSSASESYEILTDSEFEYGYIEIDNKEKVKLDDSNYSVFIKSKDRNIRKQAFELLHSKYKEFKKTITSTYTGNIERDIQLAKIRNYNSAIEASLYDDNISIDVYNNLIKVINNNLDVLYKYYDLKKEVLKLDELNLYDTYVSMIDETDKKYSFEEAKNAVLKALSVLGDDYITNLNKAFDERWIDIYHSKGKRSGAYSSGNYDVNPYVLLNFEGTLNDVSTLAHELGHSMHTYYSCKNNSYEYSSYKIFVAEVASTVNELLLANYLLNNSTDKKEKLTILNHLLDLFKATLYRQTMFAEFEQKVYNEREKNEVLTSESLSNMYYELVKKYFGENVVINDLIKYEWSRIPHFYYDFYVYKYATGLSAACYIVNGILNNRENALENYLKFLKTGGSMYPLDELKIAGVDMTDENVILSAINMFESYLTLFTELYKEV